MSDGWIAYTSRPPLLGEWEVVELTRDRHAEEPQVIRLDDLLQPVNAAMNVAGLYWRPVM